jgi:DNA-directed RNA polymerase III subunit RPC1
VEGLGLKEMMRIPGVDYRHTWSNHVMETEKVLGIEAARQTIIN